MPELYYPNLTDEELLRIARDSVDPLVEELVKRLGGLLDDLQAARNDALQLQRVLDART